MIQLRYDSVLLLLQMCEQVNWCAEPVSQAHGMELEKTSILGSLLSLSVFAEDNVSLLHLIMGCRFKICLSLDFSSVFLKLFCPRPHLKFSKYVCPTVSKQRIMSISEM